jgi:hypothetical protein
MTDLDQFFRRRLRIGLTWLAIALPLSVGLVFAANAIWPNANYGESVGIGDVCADVSLIVAGLITYLLFGWRKRRAS